MGSDQNVRLSGSFETAIKAKLYQNINKDHQKMMVDPMFMIVQNLRLFLTAVTPTAVAHTAVIF